MTLLASARSLRAVARTGRIVAVLIYLGWIVIGLAVLRLHQVDASTLRYQLVRQLPGGHRLRAHDIRPDPQLPLRDRHRLPQESDLVGKYLVRDCCADGHIGPENVATVPSISVRAGKLVFLFPLENQSELLEILNAGSRVAVYGGPGGTNLVDDARVVTVVCAPGTVMKCSAALELSKDEVLKLSGPNSKDNRLVLRG